MNLAYMQITNYDSYVNLENWSDYFNFVLFEIYDVTPKAVKYIKSFKNRPSNHLIEKCIIFKYKDMDFGFKVFDALVKWQLFDEPEANACKLKCFATFESSQILFSIKEYLL